ncbi:MAG: cyclic nucleotide-binding/CBS domain-containing protein [Nitrosopumilaceae archaeon]
MLNESVSKFTNPELTVVASEVTVTDAAKVMTDRRIDSILVFENDEVIGIVTNKDILTDVVAKGLDPSKVTIKEITHQPLIKIHKNAKVKEAIEVMSKNDIRRLVVTDDKRTIGTISRKKMIGDLHDYSVHLAELEMPGKVRCPYCSSQFEDSKVLSRHIDDIHIGKGLFEGNLSRTDELGSVSGSGFSKTL